MYVGDFSYLNSTSLAAYIKQILGLLTDKQKPIQKARMCLKQYFFLEHINFHSYNESQRSRCSAE